MRMRCVVPMADLDESPAIGDEHVLIGLPGRKDRPRHAAHVQARDFPGRHPRSDVEQWNIVICVGEDTDVRIRTELYDRRGEGAGAVNSAVVETGHLDCLSLRGTEPVNQLLPARYGDQGSALPNVHEGIRRVDIVIGELDDAANDGHVPKVVQLRAEVGDADFKRRRDGSLANRPV